MRSVGHLTRAHHTPTGPDPGKCAYAGDEGVVLSVAGCNMQPWRAHLGVS
jgi:hypothetical protein